ncbi:hypothetical protein CEXT_367571, partial [Caerostris extrusa]
MFVADTRLSPCGRRGGQQELFLRVPRDDERHRRQRVSRVRHARRRHVRHEEAQLIQAAFGWQDSHTGCVEPQ